MVTTARRLYRTNWKHSVIRQIQFLRRGSLQIFGGRQEYVRCVHALFICMPFPCSRSSPSHFFCLPLLTTYDLRTLYPSTATIIDNKQHEQLTNWIQREIRWWGEWIQVCCYAEKGGCWDCGYRVDRWRSVSRRRWWHIRILLLEWLPAPTNPLLPTSGIILTLLPSQTLLQKYFDCLNEGGKITMANTEQWHSDMHHDGIVDSAAGLIYEALLMFVKWRCLFTTPHVFVSFYSWTILKTYFATLIVSYPIMRLRTIIHNIIAAILYNKARNPSQGTCQNIAQISSLIGKRMAFHRSTAITWLAALCHPSSGTTYFVIPSSTWYRSTNGGDRSRVETDGIGGVQGTIWFEGKLITLHDE